MSIPVRFCLSFLVVLLAAPAMAADAYIQRAQALMNDTKYREAAKVLRLGLAREELGGEPMVQHFRLQAECFVSLGESGRARSAFAKILTIRPRYRLRKNVSPKVRSLFDEVHGSMEKAGLLRRDFNIEHSPVPTQMSGASPVAALSFEDAADITAVRIFVRRIGASDFVGLNAAASGNTFSASIPKTLLPVERDEYGIQYYFTAFGYDGGALAQVGDAENPLSFLVIPKAEFVQGAELETEDSLLWIPIVAGIGVGIIAVALLAGGLGVGYFFLRPVRGSADVIVTQEVP